MNFTEYVFIPLFLLFTLIYFLLPLSKRWIALLTASILFFCTWGLELLPYAIGASFIAWIAALSIDKAYARQDKEIKKRIQKEAQALRENVRKKNKYILWTAVFLIVLFLVYTKTQKLLAEYSWGINIAWFFSGIYRRSIRILLKIPLLNLFVKDTASLDNGLRYAFFVPLGISYYTMSLVGYMADVYWRKERAEKNFARLLLFTLYFPKILEGPISKHSRIAAMLNEGHTFEYRRYCWGWQRMLWGYFKKLVIADRLGIFVNTVFGSWESHCGSEFLVAAIFGAFQLYCDFSGCMDIALGASETLGIQLEENFNHPFFSRSASEFWRRWHITLGTWFKDYIYMPFVISPRLISMSGKIRNRVGKRAGKAFITAVPLAVVWLLTGLWHGTGWNYIVWGIYWGLLIILSTIFEPELKKLRSALHINGELKGYQFFQRVRTFFLFVIARIITIPDKLEVTIAAFKSIFTDFAPWKLVDGSLYSLGLDRANFNLAILTLILLAVVSKKQESGVVFRKAIDNLNIIPRWIFWFAAIFFVLICGVYGVGYDASSFVYMNY